MSAFDIGTIVTHTDSRTGKVQTGRVVSIEADAYHTVVNGVTVYYVSWFGGTTGGGWRHDDLRAA